jgi:hypothetical protein
LRVQLRMCELQSGVSMAERREVQVPEWLRSACSAETKHFSLQAACSAEEARLQALQRTVKHFEEHVSEWRLNHEQALNVISKAEHLRGKYDGMMAKLKEKLKDPINNYLILSNPKRVILLITRLIRHMGNKILI